jgi:hypothetical protein
MRLTPSFDLAPTRRIARMLLLVTIAQMAVGAGAVVGDENDSDEYAIARCLAAWGTTHPFQGKKSPPFKTLSAGVKVFGIGAAIIDDERTREPRLVLVSPSVGVMSKSTMRLLNPNGWYCLKSNVTVMSKTVIELACAASIADAREGVAVLGSNVEGTGKGVTVMGKTELRRVGCRDH